MNLPKLAASRRTFTALALTVGLGLLACGEATGPSSLNISVVPLKAEYSPGETVSIRIENNRSDPIGVSPCHAVLELLIGRTWLAVPQSWHSESEHSCVEIIRGSTAPGEELTGPVGVVPTAAPAGTYRARLVNVILESGGQPHSVASASFKVVVQ